MKGSTGTSTTTSNRSSWRTHRTKANGSVIGLKKLERMLKATPHLPQDVPPGFKRFILKRSYLNKTKEALLLEINGKLYWIPLSQAKYGFHPTGVMMAIDIPNWLVKAKKIF